MNDRRESRINSYISWVSMLWPILVALVVLAISGVGGWLKIKWDVTDIKSDQAEWKTRSEARREENHREIDTLKQSQAHDESNIEWLTRIVMKDGCR